MLQACKARGRQEALSRAVSISGSLRSEQQGQVLNPWTLPLFLAPSCSPPKKKKNNLSSSLLSLHRAALQEVKVYFWPWELSKGSSPGGLFPQAPRYAAGLTSLQVVPLLRHCEATVWVRRGKLRHNSIQEMFMPSS